MLVNWVRRGQSKLCEIALALTLEDDPMMERKESVRSGYLTLKKAKGLYEKWKPVFVVVMPGKLEFYSTIATSVRERFANENCHSC